MTKVDHGQKQEHKNPSHYPVKETIMVEKSGEKCLNSAYILLVELPRFAKRPNVFPSASKIGHTLSITFAKGDL